MISLTSMMALHPLMNGATTSQTLETSSFRGHHEACHAVLGMTPERTMTPAVTKDFVLDGTSAIKERKAGAGIDLLGQAAEINFYLHQRALEQSEAMAVADGDPTKIIENLLSKPDDHDDEADELRSILDGIRRVNS